MCEFKCLSIYRCYLEFSQSLLSLRAPSPAPAIPRLPRSLWGSLSLREGLLLASSHGPGPPALDFLQLYCS